MKKFLAVYLGEPTGKKVADFKALDEETRKERESAGMAAWGQWVQKHAHAIVDPGSPLGKTKLVNRAGISDTKNLLAAYVVVQAESHEAAAKMFEGHPHFTIFPGESVEIMELLPLPTR